MLGKERHQVVIDDFHHRHHEADLHEPDRIRRDERGGQDTPVAHAQPLEMLPLEEDRNDQRVDDAGKSDEEHGFFDAIAERVLFLPYPGGKGLETVLVFLVLEVPHDVGLKPVDLQVIVEPEHDAALQH